MVDCLPLSVLHDGPQPLPRWQKYHRGQGVLRLKGASPLLGSLYVILMQKGRREDLSVTGILQPNLTPSGADKLLTFSGAQILALGRVREELFLDYWVGDRVIARQELVIDEDTGCLCQELTDVKLETPCDFSVTLDVAVYAGGGGGLLPGVGAQLLLDNRATINSIIADYELIHPITVFPAGDPALIDLGCKPTVITAEFTLNNHPAGTVLNHGKGTTKVKTYMQLPDGSEDLTIKVRPALQEDGSFDPYYSILMLPVGMSSLSGKLTLLCIDPTSFT